MLIQKTCTKHNQIQEGCILNLKSDAHGWDTLVIAMICDSSSYCKSVFSGVGKWVNEFSVRQA